MHEYTFEEYDDARETRAWYERFLHEHNGSDWRRTLRFSLADILTGNLPKGANGEAVRIYWYRIKYQGVLIGYADAKIQPFSNGRKIISDVWINPKYRNRGHYHCLFPALVEYTNAVGTCLIRPKYELYGGWYETFGFEWLAEFADDPTNDRKNSVLYVLTRDAYKDLVRFMMRYVDGHGYPVTKRGRLLFEEVRKEIESKTG